MFTNINDVSIKNFITNIKSESLTSIYTQSFLKYIIDNAFVKPASFKYLNERSYLDNSSCYTTINNHIKPAFTNINGLNVLRFSKILNEIDINTDSDLYITTHFYITYSDASRFISISPNKDNIFTDGIESFGLSKLRNTFTTITTISSSAYY
jgi:hypothetical protein